MTNSTPTRRCVNCQRDLPATHEFFTIWKGGLLRPERPCRECIKVLGKQYDRNYALTHAAERAQNARDWSKENREVGIVRRANERALARNLPATLTADEWLAALRYWSGACAVCCTTPADTIHIALDHWVSIKDERADNPGTVLWNVLPLCHSRGGTLRCCNNTKQQRDPIEWLMDVQPREMASLTLQRINTYFASIGAIIEYRLLAEKPKPDASIPVQLRLFE